MAWNELLVGAMTAISLGDSYAVMQTEVIEEQLGIPTVQIAQAGSFAGFWDQTFGEWSPQIAEVEGPVVVFMSMGVNDERSAWQMPPETVAQSCTNVILQLLDLRPDLTIIQTGYNGECADVQFPEFLPERTDWYGYFPTSELDQRLKFGDACHPDEQGFDKRIRYVTHQR